MEGKLGGGQDRDAGSVGRAADLCTGQLCSVLTYDEAEEKDDSGEATDEAKGRQC